MSIIEITEFKVRRETEQKAMAKRRKRYTWRLMKSWTKVLRAFRDSYSCDNCIEPIMPGDEYERRVYVNNAGRLRVERQHYPDCHAPTEEEVREIEEQIEKEREGERQQSEKMVA